MSLKNYRNYAQNSNTKILTRLFENDDVMYYIQTVKIPGLQNGTITLKTQFGQLQMLGDVSEYNDLNLSIILDENLEVYKALLKYCQNIHQPGTLQNDRPAHQDITLMMYNNNNKELMKIKFYNCYLDSIGDLDYVFNSDNQELIVPCVIKYNYFKLLEDGTI